MVGGVLANRKSSRPSLAEELVLALSKPRSSKEPRGASSKTSSRTNNDDWINFLKKKKDNLSEQEAGDKVTKLEQSLKKEREKLRETEEILRKEKEAHNETKKKSGNNTGQTEDIRILLNQEKHKNKALLDELNSLRKKTGSLEGKTEERIKDLQRENAGTMSELSELKAWKEEALARIAGSAKFCETQHTGQIQKLREENCNLNKSNDENTMKSKKVLKELSVSLKKKEFEIDLLKGDLEKKNQIIHNMRTELNEMYVKQKITEGGNEKNMTSGENMREVPNKAILGPNTSTLKKRKIFPIESFVSVKKARTDDMSNRDSKPDRQNEVHINNVKQEMVAFDETIEPEEAAIANIDFVEDILDEIFENIDYIEQKPEKNVLEDISTSTADTDCSAEERLVEDAEDCWFIRDLIVKIIDNL